MTRDPAEGLNPEQRAAVLHDRGPLLVLAGAGSGKTRVVTRRLARLVADGADPRRIVAVTFTNRAAEEMRERVRSLLGVSRLESFVGTFHAWGLRFLRLHAEAAGLSPGFSIADGGDQASLVREAMAEENVSEQTFSPGAVHSRISAAKSALLTPARFAEAETDFSGARIARVYAAYEKKLKRANAADFDDLIRLPVEVLRSSGEIRRAAQLAIEHLLIDEYQDTNAAQDALVKCLAGGALSLCAVGDEDQSIYRWRGARVEHILQFEEDFPGASVVALTRNYRSTARILEAAGAVVSRNRRRRPKVLLAEGAEGSAVVARTFRDDRSESEWIVSRIAESPRPRAEHAVLFRVNAQSREIEDELVRRNIPYTFIGGQKFYERAEVKDAIAYLRLAAEPADDLAFRRVVNVPARGIGAATLDRLVAYARDAGVSLYEASEKASGLTDRARVALERFRRIVQSGGSKASGPPSELLEFLLEESGYRALYAGEDPEDVGRRENLRELVSAAREFEIREAEAASLRGFLDTMALATDGEISRAGGAVSLLTLHSAKGLEFCEVFISGVEEGFLPHTQSAQSEEEIEEERRLLYVGMTRARESLTLTLSQRRMLYGETRPRQPSRFLEDLPPSVERIDDDPAGPAASFDSEDDERGTLERPYRPAVTVARRRAQPPDAVPGLGRGQRVRHPRYGSGVILQQEGSGDEARLTVYFDRAGKKKFVAKFADLKPA